MRIVIGTRGSKLALWQCHHVKKCLLEHYPDSELIVKEIKTTGDVDQKTPLSQMGTTGLFTKQLEKALRNRTIDIAVHSFKDMPSRLEEDFSIAAVLKREKAQDVFVSQKYTIADMEKKILVGTGSLRRASQLKKRFPHIKIENLRGNVDTRLRKLREGKYDAIILAYAGLKRLELFEEKVMHCIPFEISLPAVAQGTVAIEILKENKELSSLLRVINHEETDICVREERRFLRIVEGGCKIPVACYAHITENHFIIEGFIGDLEGKETIAHKIIVDREIYEGAGRKLAKEMLDMGGKVF